MWTRTLVIMLCAASGCAPTARTRTFGGGSTDDRAPPLAGRDDVPMWDHYCAGLGGGHGGAEAFTALVDDASDQGWEMVGVTATDHALIACFKRPRPAFPTPPEPSPVETPAAPPAE